MHPTVTLNSTKNLGQSIENFQLIDHGRVKRSLEDLTGDYGVLLAFVGDIWSPVSVQRIFALQRYAPKAAKLGCPFAVVATGSSSSIANFVLSSPLPVLFPVLADPDGSVHAAYLAAQSPALLLIDRRLLPRYRWYISDNTILPPMDHVLLTAQMLHDRLKARET